MIYKDTARAAVEEQLQRWAAESGHDLVIVHTSDEGWCWLFGYNSRAYVETGDFSSALAGNGPIAVDKETGELHHLVTGRPIEPQLEEIRAARR